MMTMKKPALENSQYSPSPMDPQMRTLSYIPRWSIIRTTRTQNVAEHSYYVAVYTKQICDWLDVEPDEKAKLVWMALMHDVDEMITGDIPTPSKKRHLYIHPDRDWETAT